MQLRRQVVQSNFIDPLCFRTIVVLLMCHLFKDSCIFVFIAIFLFQKNSNIFQPYTFCDCCKSGNHYKQAHVFGNNCQQSVTDVVTMILDSAKSKRDDTMKYLEKIGDR